MPILALTTLTACSATNVTQSDWKSSPTGEWLTRIERVDTAGPGAGDLNEIVQVRRRTATKPIGVFTLSEMDGPAAVKLRWRDQSHLEIAYDKGEVVFQAVKVGNLKIETVKATTK